MAIRRHEQGLAATEFAFLLPLYMAVILLVLAVMFMAFDKLWVAAMVPQDARQISIGQSPHYTAIYAGQSPAQAGRPSDCTRMMTVRLNGTTTTAWGWIRIRYPFVSLDLVGPQTASVSGISNVYRWGWNPGRDASGACQ